MGGRVTADLQALRSIVDQMQGDSDFIEDRLRLLDDRMETLRNTWRGEASTAQSDAHTEWASGARAMRSALDELRGRLDTTHCNLEAAVKANARMWGI